MSTHQAQIDRNSLLRIGWEARDNNGILDAVDIDGTNVRGSCIEITKHVIGELHDQYDLPENDVIEYRCNVGEDMELHYAVAIAAHHITDCGKLTHL